MPATFTHGIFAIDVYNELLPRTNEVLDSNLTQYKMFAQSMDSMMFYNIESIKPGKSLRTFQHTFHSTKTREFFITLTKYIKEKNIYNDSEVMAFLYGFVCHYVLDSNIHPFVFYKTGYFNKKDKESYKYNNLHSFMETYLDNYLITKRISSVPYNFRIDNFCFDLKRFNYNLQECIDYVFNKVFNIKNMAKIYYISLKQMKGFLRRYRFDKLGIKRFGYRAIDYITPKFIFRFEALSYHYHPKDSEYYLNLKHNIWYNPCDKKLFSYESFDDLYKKSIIEAVKIIEKLNSYFKGINVNLDNIFTNKSYISGLDCDKNLTLKNFYF